MDCTVLEVVLVCCFEHIQVAVEGYTISSPVFGLPAQILAKIALQTQMAI